MIRDILEKFNIWLYAFIPASLCRAANERLFGAVPENANVIFTVIPYYCGDADKKLSAYGAVYDYHGFARKLFVAALGFDLFPTEPIPYALEKHHL